MGTKRPARRKVAKSEASSNDVLSKEALTEQAVSAEFNEAALLEAQRLLREAQSELEKQKFVAEVAGKREDTLKNKLDLVERQLSGTRSTISEMKSKIFDTEIIAAGLAFVLAGHELSREMTNNFFVALEAMEIPPSQNEGLAKLLEETLTRGGMMRTAYDVRRAVVRENSAGLGVPSVRFSELSRILIRR